MKDNMVKVTTGTIRTELGVFSDADMAVQVLNKKVRELQEEAREQQAGMARLQEDIGRERLARCRAEGEAGAYRSALEILAGSLGAGPGSVVPEMNAATIRDMLVGEDDDGAFPEWDDDASEDGQTLFGRNVVDDLSGAFSQADKPGTAPHDSDKLNALAADILQGMMGGKMDEKKVRTGFAELLGDAIRQKQAGQPKA